MATPLQARSVRWLPEADGWRRFELTSRGDRVVARLRVPEGDAPCPVAVVLAESPEAAPALPGCATLAFDLPLLAGRASPKWTERLRACLAAGPAGAADRGLLDAFVAQAAADASATLDVCAALEGLAPRAGALGLGAGALVVARLRGTEPRLRALAASPVGLAAALDPGPALARGEPRCAVAAEPAEAAARLREALEAG